MSILDYSINASRVLTTNQEENTAQYQISIVHEKVCFVLNQNQTANGSRTNP
jgi:hypothetical protein